TGKSDHESLTHVRKGMRPAGLAPELRHASCAGCDEGEDSEIGQDFHAESGEEEDAKRGGRGERSGKANGAGVLETPAPQRMRTFGRTGTQLGNEFCLKRLTSCSWGNRWGRSPRGRGGFPCPLP